MIKDEIKCADGRSVFRVESGGKIRLILLPEDRSVLIGQLCDQKEDAKSPHSKAVLLLYKSKSDFSPKSYTVGAPQELLDTYPGVAVIAVHTRDRDNYFCALRAKFDMFGSVDYDPNIYRHKYNFLDFEHWSQVGDIEDVMNFYADQKTLRGGRHGSEVNYQR